MRLHAPTEPKAGLSFPEFYRQCAPGLVAFVQWLGAGIHEADDVAQETMARAYRSWESIEHPRTWIRTVASREYLRRVTTCHDEPTAEISGVVLGPAADEAAALGQEQAAVLDVLRLLPPRQRQVMAWCYDGYTPAEIAGILGIKPGTARVNLHKAREVLKQHLTGEGGQSR